ncbi:Uncharacterised protein [Bacteroides faecis]|uniref:Uncharacterized protein n=1 Tax=Bacteroides faecis TaxID=674529 RepID=A0A6N2XF89_9BACE
MYNVKITVENLKVLNDRCTGKFKIFKNIMIMNMIVYPIQKKNRKVPPYFPIRNSQKSTLINLLT